MKAVFRHELQSYFTTPVGYIFLAMYTLLAGVVYVFINIGQESSASMNLMFSGMQLPLMLITPLLTMRLFAEERRMRTDQLLFTVPVRVFAIVLGKTLAAISMLFFSMGLTVLFPIVISRWAQISAAQMAATYLGYFLHGASLISMGVLISSLCVNQVSAAVVTLGINVFLYMNEHYILPQMTPGYLAPIRTLLQWLPGTQRLGDFSNGVISPADGIYFLSFSVLMVFFTCRVLTARRYEKG